MSDVTSIGDEGVLEAVTPADACTNVTPPAALTGTPTRRFVDKAFELALMGTEFTDTILDDLFVGQMAQNEAVKDWIAGKIDDLLAAEVEGTALTLSAPDERLAQLVSAEDFAIEDVIAVVRLIFSIINRWKNKTV